jgi:hypothetical protein
MVYNVVGSTGEYEFWVDVVVCSYAQALIEHNFVGVLKS